MHLQSDRVPAYGETVTVVVRLHESEDWFIIPATVRWFSRGGFGVAFEALDRHQELATHRVREPISGPEPTCSSLAGLAAAGTPASAA